MDSLATAMCLASNISNPVSEGHSRASASKECVPQVNAQYLPLEIVQDIFEMLLFPIPLLRVHLSQHRNASPELWRTLPYICRKWYGIALRVLYASIALSTCKGTARLHDALQEHLHLRPLIKRLHVPIRVNAKVPPMLYTSFCQIIELVEDLQEVTTYFAPTTEGMSERLESFPIPPNKHSNLDVLAVYGNKADSVDYLLMIQITNLRYLRHLTLANITLEKRVDCSSVPVLPLLESITFEGDHTFVMMDDWLCEHPKLNTLRLYETTAPSSPPRLLSKGNLVNIEMMHWHWNDTSLSAWFAACTSLRRLRITEEILKHRAGDMPTQLEELVIDFVCFWVDLQEWEVYLDRTPNISRIIFNSHLEVAWHVTMGNEFVVAAAKQGLEVEYQFPDCDCMERYARKYNPGDALTSAERTGGTESEADMDGWDYAPGSRSEEVF